MGINKWQWAGGAALIGLIGLAACSESTAPEDEALLALVADQAAAATAEQVGMMRRPGIPGWGFPHLTVRGVDTTPDCPMEGSTYVCTFGRGGVETTVEITFLDGSGQAQAAYDESTTASVHMTSASERSFTREAATGFSMRSADLTVSGLEGAETTRTWTGTASGESTRSSDERGTSAMTFLSEMNEVVIPHPRQDDSWPISGTIRSTVSGTFTDPEGIVTQVDRDLTVEFNGTQFPTATLNGEAVELDLASRRGHMQRGHHK
ncbi:MAG: hypothetical protein R3E10_12580 [Gemmatimonadota bacterium]